MGLTGLPQTCLSVCQSNLSISSLWHKPVFLSALHGCLAFCLSCSQSIRNSISNSVCISFIWWICLNIYLTVNNVVCLYLAGHCTVSVIDLYPHHSFLLRFSHWSFTKYLPITSCIPSPSSLYQPAAKSAIKLPLWRPVDCCDISVGYIIPSHYILLYMT